MADRDCDLECVKHDKGGDNTIEFVGPVKIILVDQPKNKYIRKKCAAGLIVMAQMLMATSALLVMFFSLSYKKSTYLKALHIFLCTVGFQVLIPSAILAINNLNGSSVPMKIPDRRFEHFFLQCFGLTSSLMGGAASYYADFTSLFTLHSYLGFLAVAFAIVSAVTGLWIYPFRSETSHSENNGVFYHFTHVVHRIIGLTAFSLSSGCFICGVIKIPFVKWLPLQDIFYFLVVFCIFYTLVIIYKPIKRLL